MYILSDITLVVNYDADNGWTTLFDKLVKTPKITKEVSNALNELSGLNITAYTTAKELGNRIGYTDEQFFKFAKQADLSGDVLQQYKDYTVASSKATSAFSATLKSVAANIGIMLIATIAIKGIAWAYDEVVHHQEKLNEKATESANEYKTLAGEVDSLNSGLKTTAQRIDELNGKENLSLVEQDELSKLKEQNSELERELDIKQRLADIANKQANDDAKAALSSSANYGYDNGTDFVSVRGNQVDTTMLQVEHYQVLQDAIKRTKEQMDALIKADPENYTNSHTYRDLANSYDGLIYQSDELEKTVSDNISTFMELDDSLSSTDAESKILLDSLSLLYGEFDKAFRGVGQSSDNKINEVFSRPTLEATKETLVNLGKSGSLSVDVLNSRFSGLIQTLSDAGVGAQELYDYIMALTNPDEINLDSVRSSLYDQFVKPSEGTDDTDFNQIAENYDSWIKNKSDEELKIIYSIKASTDTSSWSFEDYDKAINDRKSETLNVDLSYSATVTELGKMNEAFASLTIAYEKFSDANKDIEFSDIASLSEQFKDVSGIENYVKAIQDANGNTEATQEAFNNLTSAYLTHTGILDQVNEGNARLIQSYLQEQGVTNAVALVDAQLVVQRNQARLAALDLSSATYSEIEALVNEIGVTDEAKFAINQFYLEKITANGIALSTSGDIANIMSLVQACGGGIAALKALADAKQGLFTSFQGTLAKNDWANSSTIGLAENQKKANEALADYKRRESKLLNDANAEINAVLNKKYSSSSGNYGGNIPNKTSGGGGSGGSKKGGGGGSGSGSAKESTVETFDWIETLIKRTDEKIEKLQKKATDAIGWRKKNKLQDTVFDELQNKITALNQEYDIYMKKANSVGLSDIYIQKIQNGSFEIEDVSDENVKKMIKDYETWYDKAMELKDSIDDTNDSIQETKELKLDNIINDYEKLISLMKSYTSYREKLVDLRDKWGDEIEQDDYQDLIYDQADIYRELESEYNNLNKAFNSSGIEKGSDKWYEMKEQLSDLQAQMVECESTIEDFKDKIIEIRFKPFDDFIRKLESGNDELSDMISLIGDDGLTKDGMITDKGLAAIGLYGQQLINAKKQAAEYKAAIKALNATYEDGDITLDEYNEKLYEYQSAQRDAALATKEARDAVIALREQAIEEEIDSMNELIQTKKDALDAEEKLYEYQKKISSSNKNIAALEKQIATLSLSSDSDSKMQRLQLEQKLAEAKEELADYQRDYSIDAQKEALDKEGESYEKAKRDEIENLKTNLDAQDALIKKYLGQVKDNYSIVYGVLTEYADTYNMDVTDDLTNPFSSAESATQSFQDAFSDMVSSIQYSIDSIDWGNMTSGISSGSGTGSGDYEDVTGEGKWVKNSTGWWYGNSDDDYVSDGYYNISGKTYGFNGDGYMIRGWDDSQGEWYYFEPENGQMVKSNWRKSKKGDWYYLTSNGSMATDSAVKARDGQGYYYVDSEGMWDGKTLTDEEIKRLGYDVAYKNGTRNAKSGIALTDEDGPGSEVIFTKSGVLRQVDAGDSVFNSEQVKKLYDWSKNMDMYRSFAPEQNIPAVTKRETVNINSPLVKIDGTGLSGNEVREIISKEVDEMPKRFMKALKYEKI